MTNELLNRLEEKINAAVETIELSRMEISELKEENEQLENQQSEWEERLTVLIEKFEQLENNDGRTISAETSGETEAETEDSEDSESEAFEESEDDDSEDYESEGSTFGAETASFAESPESTGHYA